jgi:hypothetical protein
MRGDLRRLRFADPLRVKSRFRTPRRRPKSRTAARGRSPSRRATGRIGPRHTFSLRFSRSDSSRRESAALLRCRQCEDRHARSSRGRSVAFAFPLRGSGPQENHDVHADDCRYFREDGHAKRGAARALAYWCVCKYMYYQSLGKRRIPAVSRHVPDLFSPCPFISLPPIIRGRGVRPGWTPRHFSL